MTVTVSHVHGAFKQSKGMYHDFVKSLSTKCFQYMHLPFCSVGLFKSLSNFCERNSQWPIAIEHTYQGYNNEIEAINDKTFKKIF